MLVCAAAFLGIGASAAGAATAGQGYGYTKDIGTPDAGAFTGIFTQIVAVSNDDGNVFIARQGNPGARQDAAVDVLDPTTGESLSRTLTSSFPSGVAVSADGKELFITDSLLGGPPEKWIRTSTAPLTYEQDPSWSTPELSGTSGMAVDPTTGDLVVADGGRIAHVDPETGIVLSSFNGSNTGSGTVTGPRTIAVPAAGDVYVVDYSVRVEHFAADGT